MHTLQEGRTAADYANDSDCSAEIIKILEGGGGEEDEEEDD
jgi:hypothetical protein